KVKNWTLVQNTFYNEIQLQRQMSDHNIHCIQDEGGITCDTPMILQKYLYTHCCTVHNCCTA
ncbi:MAG: hypothetical protein ACRC6N_04625, partial [Plesiomonas sp.]|uniref:hypothetical protein n=1 Tax=Plesiomonas sp. TaxID=2486279 RepID=UPI003F40EA8A